MYPPDHVSVAHYRVSREELSSGAKGYSGVFYHVKKRGTFLWVVFATLYLSRLRVFFVSWPFSLKSDAAIKADIVRIICGE
jgi:hypothetical protein